MDLIAQSSPNALALMAFVVAMLGLELVAVIGVIRLRQRAQRDVPALLSGKTLFPRIARDIDALHALRAREAAPGPGE